MNIVIIGGGPAGLMAAETASASGAQVELYDAMASVGRKFLLAGKGGLNLTHSEPFERFLSRYGARRTQNAHVNANRTIATLSLAEPSSTRKLLRMNIWRDG